MAAVGEGVPRGSLLRGLLLLFGFPRGKEAGSAGPSEVTGEPTAH